MSASRVALAEDLPALGDCLASAFFDDPLWGPWSFPDPASRSEPLGRLMGFWADVAVPHGWVRMDADARTVAVWIPPGVAEMTPEQEARFEALTGELFGGPREPELRALFELFERHHPPEPCFYLSLWGTHRDHVGHGLGTALLRECLELIDAAGEPAYLESTNPVNVERYEALGFVRRDSFARPGGPPVTTMWREPPVVS
ncbi:MAG TPA: GNAT family N-acetyltransferase [Solirubrobacteraceae bacterium]